MKNTRVAVALLSITTGSYLNAQGWAALYALDVAHAVAELPEEHYAITFDRVLPMPASQLIFSWNAYRPARGYFIFYVQVRTQGARRWSEWYKLALWGAGEQRSFEQLFSDDPSFCYVRFEMPSGTLAHECRVKIEAHAGAKLTDIARVMISAADYQKFSSEVGKGKFFSFPSLIIDKVPQFSQMEIDHADRDRMCSPTSLSMVLSYLLKRPIDPYTFARGVFDGGLKSYGSWPFNTAHAFERVDGRYYFAVARLNSFAHLYGFLRNRLPVVVSVRGALRGMPAGRTYADGHLLVVVGWDESHKRVLVHDPAFVSRHEVAHSYAIDDFLAAWERSYRLAYVVEPCVD